MARKYERVFDPKTRTWSRRAIDEKDRNSTNVSTNVNTSNTAPSSTNNGGNLTNSTSSSDNSKGSVEKQYNTITYNTLSGTLNFIANEHTIKLRAGDTVYLKGFGNYLSGYYYVQDITRTISSNGLALSATVFKTDFGDSLKTRTNGNYIDKKASAEYTYSSDNALRTYTVKKGDCLWNIAKKFYGKGSEYKKIYDANTNKIADPKRIYVGQVLVIP